MWKSFQTKDYVIVNKSKLIAKVSHVKRPNFIIFGLSDYWFVSFSKSNGRTKLDYPILAQTSAIMRTIKSF